MSFLDEKLFVFDDGDVPGQCAQDTVRNIQFQKAIQRALQVSGEKILLDVGAGVGLLAFMGLKAGAEKAILVEGNQHLIKWAQYNVLKNGFQERVKIIYADASKFDWPHDIAPHPNVVTAELLTAWCVSEHQVQVLNSLHERGIVHPTTQFVPQAQENYISFAQVNFTVADDIILYMPYHAWNWYPETSPLRVKELSPRVLVGSIEFNKINPEEFTANVEVEIIEDGQMNALYLTSVTKLFEDITVSDTMALNGPVTLPLKEELSVKRGEKYDFHVRYYFGAGYENLHFKITKIK